MKAPMKAWVVASPGPLGSGPLVPVELERPEPGPGEIRVRVTACGVCRTDLHLAEGDLPPHRPRTVPGHQIVGVVDAVGEAVGDAPRPFAVGDRAGIAWLRHVCGRCRWCRHGRENLCIAPGFTGWDADGGYAEWAVVDEAYAYRLPDTYDDQHAAPLLCAGIIGYRALKLAEVPPGGRLGIWGFGASAHLTAQIAIGQGATVHVVTRSAAARELALDLGAASASDGSDPLPELLDSALLFAPAGALVPPALAALDRGGTLAVAGIHLSEVPPLDYEAHLFQERQLRSVTANTRADGDELLPLAARLGVQVTTTPYPLDAADRALTDLATSAHPGAPVLLP